MKLSILICYMKSRTKILERLINVLNPQLTDEVEVIIDTDQGEKTIGKKRDDLLRKAKGEYLSFVDDDDLISPNYVSLILKAIESKPDVVGINLIMTVDKVIEERSFHSIKYDRWWDEPDPDKPWLKRYYRNPNHLNPVKREIALQVGFKHNLSGTEDKVYSDSIKQYLKTEEYIEEPIYYFEHFTNKKRGE